MSTDFLDTCRRVLSELEVKKLVRMIIDERLLTHGQEVAGCGVFSYEDTLLLSREGEPIRSILILEDGERVVPESTKTHFEQVIEEHGLRKEQFTVDFLEKLHGFRLRVSPMDLDLRAFLFAESFDKVIRARAGWQPRAGADMAAGWIRSTVFKSPIFLHADLALASFVCGGEDPLQQAVVRSARAPRELPHKHAVDSAFMQKLYRDMAGPIENDKLRVVVAMMFAHGESQTKQVALAVTRFKIVLRCHGTAGEQVLTHIWQWKAQGLVNLRNATSVANPLEGALEKFKIAVLLCLNVTLHVAGERAVVYTHMAAEMLMWCAMCALNQNLTVRAMHFAQHALCLISCYGEREDSKWLAIGIASIMDECYLRRNMLDVAHTCERTAFNIFSTMDGKVQNMEERVFFLRSVRLRDKEESAWMFGKMEKWRVKLYEVAPKLAFPEDWTSDVPLFTEVICVTDQLRECTRKKTTSTALNDMMYTYAVKKWHALLIHAATLFHSKEEMAAALDLFEYAMQSAKILQSINLQLYSSMYVADCMLALDRTRDACFWYTKFVRLAGGFDVVLNAELFHDAPELAADVALNCATSCCMLWEEGLVSPDATGFASLKQVQVLLHKLQFSRPIPAEKFFASVDLRARIRQARDKVLEQKFHASRFAAIHPLAKTMCVWRSNVKAIQLLNEEAGAAVVTGKKKKTKKKASARATSAGAGLCEKAESPRAAAAPDKPREQKAEEAAKDAPPAPEAGDGPPATDECCMCLEAPKLFMFAPCGHRCVCETCAGDVMRTNKECPLCRTAAASIFKVFL